jgi:hypothetical protein
MGGDVAGINQRTPSNFMSGLQGSGKLLSLGNAKITFKLKES